MPAVIPNHPSIEDARSALLDLVRQIPLSMHFSKASLKAAESVVAMPELWREAIAWYQPPGSHSEALQHEFADFDGRPHLVTVYLYRLFGQPTPESLCTCGASRCLHACALLLALQTLVAWPRPMTPLQRWRRALEMRPALTPRPRSAPPRKSRELICLIDTHSNRPASLTARLILVNSRDDLHRPDAWLSIDSLPAHALSAQAVQWQAQLSSEQSAVLSTPSVYPISGVAGSVLFRELLQAGICYHARNLRKLFYGDLQEPVWQWTQDADAHVQVALVFPHETVELVELDGLYFLDESSGAFSPLKLTHTVWSMLERMPPLSPADAVFRRDWPPHPTLANIPAPPPSPLLSEQALPLELTLLIGTSRDPQRGDYVFYFTPYANYGDSRLPLAKEPWNEQLIRRRSGQFVTIRRDIEQELHALAALKECECVPLRKLRVDAGRSLTPTPGAQALSQREYLRGKPEILAAFASYLQALFTIKFRIEYDPDIPFAILPMETPFTATLSKGQAGGWTQFELAVELDGAAFNMLPVILDGLKHRAFSLSPSVNEPPGAHWLAPIGAHRFLPLRLSQLREWLAPLLSCLHRASPKANRALELSRSQSVALADCLQGQGASLAGARAADISEILATLRAVHQSAPRIAPPPSFHGVLRSYQLTGLQWLQALRETQLGGILADDMGLGKTVQIIAHLMVELEAGRLQRPALIIVPTSLVFNWLDEIARFAPALRCLNFTGPERSRRRGEATACQVLLISYPLLTSEASWLETLQFSMLVLDEAQWIKNPLTQTARAVRALRASHRLVLTGTPLENHLGELWAHIDSVMPGLLGEYPVFKRMFRVPIEAEDNDARMALLRQRVAPFVLRRTKAAVAPELPPKTETVLRVALPENQRRLYESLRLSLSGKVREALERYTEEESRIVVLAALLRLRQVCCDPRLLGDTHANVGSAKLDALLELIRSLREEQSQVLVFSQFTTMLGWISRRLTHAHLDHALLTGKTVDRASPVRRFQSGEVPILLASLKAGGVGLNLTGADAVIQYDPWWNPAVETQAVDRAHRIGRQSPVFVYKLICEDTIEEKIESMKERKGRLATALLGDDPGSVPLTESDLKAVFDFGFLDGAIPVVEDSTP
jgi:superfamily II DNA or RNA helicase